MRSVFLALPLEGDARLAFQALQECLRPWAGILRFQNGQTPHVTLQFWKEAGELELAGIRAQAAKIASAARPFELRTTGADTFGAKGGDRVLFLSVEFSPPLASLKKQCPWDTRLPFHPHVTLARIAHPQRFAVVKKQVMKALGAPIVAMHVDRLRLYAEVGGAAQTPLQDFAFTQPPPRP